MIHCLKIWPEHFQQVLSGAKPFEIRKDDRGFAVGDLVCLREFEPATQDYTGRELQRRISCITRSAGPVALLDGLVVLGLEDARGMGSPARDLVRLGGLLQDLALALGVPMNFGVVEEARLLDRAVEVRQAFETVTAPGHGAVNVADLIKPWAAPTCDLVKVDYLEDPADTLTARLVAIRGRIQDAHGTLMLGSAPGAREHLQQAAAELTDVIEGRV